jgi:hypothetical protein
MDPSTPGSASIGTCESCGRDDEDLVEVHRVYVRVADDGSQQIDEVPEPEGWCASCRATYPHAVI